MKKPKLILKWIAIFACCFTITSCIKMPNADFKSDKPSYVAGETITLTSNSSKAKNFRWTMPDGTTQKGESVKYLIPINSYGSLLFKLEALSGNGKRSDHIVKSIWVDMANGTLVLRGQSSSFQNATISIDGGTPSSIGNIPYSSVAVNCSSEGFPKYTVPSGFHNITIFVQYNGFFYNIQKTASVSPGQCIELVL